VSAFPDRCLSARCLPISRSNGHSKMDTLLDEPDPTVGGDQSPIKLRPEH
jgi:hypothetical protein